MDPVELRRKNALRVGSITNTGQVLRDSVGLLECIEKVEAEMMPPGRAEIRSQPTQCPAQPHLRARLGLRGGLQEHRAGRRRAG